MASNFAMHHLRRFNAKTHAAQNAKEDSQSA